MKFKVWDKKKKKFVELEGGYYIHSSGKLCYFGNAGMDFADSCYEAVLSSGSTSYSGTEIYEGDKVIAEYDELGSEIPVNFNGVVQRILSGFYVTNNDLQMMFPVFQEIAQWRITGNIHEGT